MVSWPIHWSAFCIESYVALDRNTGSGYDTILLRLIPGYIYSARPYRQFHTLPGLLHSQAALSNSYPDTCVPNSLYHFMTVFGVTWPGRELMTNHLRGGYANN